MAVGWESHQKSAAEVHKHREIKYKDVGRALTQLLLQPSDYSGMPLYEACELIHVTSQPLHLRYLSFSAHGSLITEVSYPR